MLAGVNADTRSIPDGCPVGWLAGRKELDRVVRAGGGVRATGVTVSGSIQRGVINFLEEGTVTLDDWTPVTGSKTLTEGSTYRLGDVGRLTTSGTGQIVGLASNIKSLKLAIDRTGSSPDPAVTVSYATAADLESLRTMVLNHINNLSIHAAALSTRTWELTPNADTGTVSGLALTFVPSHINICGVLKPVNGEHINAWVVDGTITATGFDYTLDGQPLEAGYTLVYQIIP